MPRSHVVVPNVALAPVGRTSTIAGACSAIRNQFSKRCKAQGKVNSSGAHTPSLAPPKLHGGSLTLTVYPRYQNRPTWAPARRRWDTSRHWPARFFENIRLVDQSVHFCAAVVHHSKFGSAMSQMGLGCVKTRRGITTPGILSPVVMRRAKKHKNASSARHYDQIRFRFHTAWAQSDRYCAATECPLSKGGFNRSAQHLLILTR